jgi:hypothetical protein
MMRNNSISYFDPIKFDLLTLSSFKLCYNEHAHERETIQNLFVTSCCTQRCLGFLVFLNITLN